jgi:hypothetical protein
MKERLMEVYRVDFWVKLLCILLKISLKKKFDKRKW